MVDIDGDSWLPSPDAAKRAGISAGTLRARRRREGSRHPEHVRCGNAVLYRASTFTDYCTSRVDGRAR